MDTPPFSRPESLTEVARDVFLADLAQRAPGEAVDVEALCALRPELAAELRRVESEWRGMSGDSGRGSSQRAEARHADAVDLSTSGRDANEAEEDSERFVRRLAARQSRDVRYANEEEIARGGMGAILRVWDRDLRRHLAMKVALNRSRASRADAGSSPRRNPDQRAAQIDPALDRFIEEAQITGQLEHPGIVPVHEIGLDSTGKLFFTMRLVRGQDLRRVFELAWREEGGWSQTRAVGILLKACEALAYAHSKGVLHRDLKPANVMVGSFGEVYVMDWGIARVLGRRDRHDLHFHVGESPPGAASSTRSAAADRDSDSPLRTRDGDVVGTPAYMSPEQARGELDRLSPSSDVYSVGAMLYHLLAHSMPYARTDGHTPASAVLAQVLDGPPRSLRELRQRIPRELVAICEKAMAREPERRYPTTSEMADDLRDYLEGRVVGAHRTGWIASSSKWVARNRALAASLATLLALASFGTFAVRQSRDRQQSLDLLADLRGPDELLADFDTLWPTAPDKAPSQRTWLERAEAMRDRRARYASLLNDLRRRAQPVDFSAPLERRFARERQRIVDLAPAVLELTRGEIVLLERTSEPGPRVDEMLAGKRRELISLERTARGVSSAAPSHVTWRFDDSHDQLMNDRLTQFLSDAAIVVGDEQPSPLVLLVRAGLAAASASEPVDAAAWERAWDAAIRSIGDVRECPSYGGLVMQPQTGLVPVGRDRDTGLWEFAHMQSGRVPERDAAGRLEIGLDSAIVLVLVPGGRTAFGSQRDEPARAYFDPESEFWDGPVAETYLDAYMISKHELTRAQSVRLTGSVAPPEQSGIAPSIEAGMFPAGGIDRQWGEQALAAYGLSLPTSAQWECAARAGTTSPYCYGETRSCLEGAANVADQSYLRSSTLGPETINGVVEFDDGFTSLAPVGSFRPNAFGLHDVAGNVAEVCSDRSIPRMANTKPGRGDLSSLPYDMAILRGGSSCDGALSARSAARQYVRPDYRAWNAGVRAVRNLDPRASVGRITPR